MKNKIIVISSNTSWYIYNFRKNLILSLQTNGYQVITIAPTDEYSETLVKLGVVYYPIKIDSKSKNPFKDLFLIYEYFKLLKKTEPTVLLNFTAKPNIYATIAASFLKISTINNIAGLGIGFVNNNLVTKVLKLLYRLSQKRAFFVFFQNEDDYNLFKDNNLVLDKNTFVLPGSGVNLTAFNKVQLTEFNNLKPFRFVLVARMLYSKGVKLLVEASIYLKKKGYNNFEVILIGEADVNSEDAISFEQLNLWSQLPFIKYLGKTDNVFDLLKTSHCMVLPTYYREGVPRSLLEALASGLPIITTNMPGSKTTVVDNLNGYIVKPRDMLDLSFKMEHILNLSYIELQKMGNYSRKLAEEKFDENIVINKYLEVIRQIKN